MHLNNKLFATLFLLVIVSIGACKNESNKYSACKDNCVYTGYAVSFDNTSAVLKGRIEGNNPILPAEFGFVCSKSKYPDFDNGIVKVCYETDDSQSFMAEINDLEPGTTYYFKAFIKSGAIIKTGDVAFFTTSGLRRVDLGLSVLWADRNLGASSSSAVGRYYPWGGISVPSHYYSPWIRHEGGSLIIEKYNNYDCRYTLELEDDIAHNLLGGKWRTPTIIECDELFNKCEWVEQKDGFIVTGPSKESIFIPKTGYYSDNERFWEDTCFLWSSSVYSNDYSSAYCLISPGKCHSMVKLGRCYALPIRPVQNK